MNKQIQNKFTKINFKKAILFSLLSYSIFFIVALLALSHLIIKHPHNHTKLQLDQNRGGYFKKKIKITESGMIARSQNHIFFTNSTINLNKSVIKS